MEENQEKSEVQESSKIIGNLLKSSYTLNEKENREECDRCVGSILSVMVGDILGSAVEGRSRNEISTEFPNGVRDFISGPHMGVMRGDRFGMYTDDTQTTLALAQSLIECNGLNPLHAARNYAKEVDVGQERGYPGTAKKIFKAVASGRYSFLETGTIAIGNGSFANGGCMRISPIGITYRNATDQELHEAVKMAIASSHVHPEAIDSAFIQAKAVSIMIHTTLNEFDPLDFITTLTNLATEQDLRTKLTSLRTFFKKVKDDENVTDKDFKEKIPTPSFQIKATDAMLCCLWFVIRYYKDPEEAIIRAVSFGGDTDTIGSMVGGILGALHGTEWIPHRWFDKMENEDHGRDFCINLGEKLSKLDLHTVLEYEENLPLEMIPLPRHIKD